MRIFRSSGAEQSQAYEASQKDAEAQILKLVEEQLGERERAVKAGERQLKTRWARLNECMNVVNSALIDTGHPNLAATIEAKVRGTWQTEEGR